MGCSRGVPGLFRAVPGCSGGVPGVFRGVPGGVPGVPGCSRFYRHPVSTASRHPSNNSITRSLISLPDSDNDYAVLHTLDEADLQQLPHLVPRVISHLNIVQISKLRLDFTNFYCFGFVTRMDNEITARFFNFHHCFI